MPLPERGGERRIYEKQFGGESLFGLLPCGRGLGSSGARGCQPGGHPDTSSTPSCCSCPPLRPAPTTRVPSRAKEKGGGRQSSLPSTPPARGPVVFPARCSQQRDRRRFDAGGAGADRGSAFEQALRGKLNKMAQPQRRGGGVFSQSRHKADAQTVLCKQFNLPNALISRRTRLGRRGERRETPLDVVVVGGWLRCV